jgi:hypothetical protein
LLLHITHIITNAQEIVVEPLVAHRCQRRGISHS